MSMPGMEKPPGHGTDLVEELQSIFGPFPVDGASRDEQLQMAVDLLGGAVGDPPEVRAVATGTTVAFSEVRRDRAGSTNQLIGDRLEGCGHSNCEPESDAGCLDGDAVDGES